MSYFHDQQKDIARWFGVSFSFFPFPCLVVLKTRFSRWLLHLQDIFQPTWYGTDLSPFFYYSNPWYKKFVWVELTSAQRTALHQYIFPVGTTNPRIFVDLKNYGLKRSFHLCFISRRRIYTTCQTNWLWHMGLEFPCPHYNQHFTSLLRWIVSNTSQVLRDRLLMPALLVLGP